MKKFILTAYAVLCLGFCVGCGSSSNLVGTKQREANNLPRWAGEGISFFSADAELYGAPKLSENGFYACGMSENLDNIRLTADSARLSANRALAGYINTEMKTAEKRVSSSTSVSYQQFDESFVSVAMRGAMLVDTFTDKDGTAYALAFISESNLKRNFANDESQSNLINEVINKAENALPQPEKAVVEEVVN